MNERQDDENINEGRELARRLAGQWVHEGTELVPIVLIALEVGEDAEQVADHLGDAVELDDVGMRVVPATTAKKFFAARAEQEARMREQFLRLEEAQAPASVPAGIPRPPNADPTMSALEVLMSVDADRPDPDKRVSPQEEFLTQRLGRPRKVEDER